MWEKSTSSSHSIAFMITLAVSSAGHFIVLSDKQLLGSMICVHGPSQDLLSYKVHPWSL